MDVTIGAVTRVGDKSDTREGAGAQLEARLLHVRGPRRTRGSAAAEERAAGSPAVDPPGARVLVLLVPDAFRLPPDLDQGRYRVFLRFVRR
jgi:hypothetical protein